MGEMLGPLVLFSVAMTLTPGPNVVLVTASAANFGFRRTIPPPCEVEEIERAGILHRIARADASSATARAKPIGFLEATLFTWMNPKAWVSALGAVAAYSTVGGDVLWQTSAIAGVLAATCLASVAI